MARVLLNDWRGRIGAQGQEGRLNRFEGMTFGVALAFAGLFAFAAVPLLRVA